MRDSGSVPAGSVAAPGRGAGAVLAFGAAVVVTTEFAVMGIAPAMADSLSEPVASIGALITWFAVGSAFLGPLAVQATRRLRTDRALALALLPFAAGLFTPWVTEIEALRLLRLVQGAALPLYIGCASEALTRLWGRDDLAIARVYLGTIVGAVLGPPAAMAMTQLAGWSMALAAMGGLALVATALVLLQPTLRAPTGVVVDRTGFPALRTPSMGLHLVLSVTQFAAMFCCYSYLAGLLNGLNLAPHIATLWVLAFGMAGLLGNAAASRVPAARTQTSTLVAAGGLAAAFALALLFERHRWLLAPGIALWGAAHAASFVVCQLRVSRAAPEHPRLASAMNISAANIGISIGAAIGGHALSAAGMSMVLGTGVVLATVAGTLALLASYPEAPDAAI